MIDVSTLSENGAPTPEAPAEKLPRLYRPHAAQLMIDRTVDLFWPSAD